MEFECYSMQCVKQRPHKPQISNKIITRQECMRKSQTAYHSNTTDTTTQHRREENMYYHVSYKSYTILQHPLDNKIALALASIMMTRQRSYQTMAPPFLR
jgi:hypothetical protein